MKLAEEVYQLLEEIPEGKVTTYKELAKALDTRAYQAIGQVLKNNPDAPRVPCHRVVKSDGRIGGYSGKRSGPSVKKKVNLLKKEGISFEKDKVKNFESVKHEF